MCGNLGAREDETTTCPVIPRRSARKFTGSEFFRRRLITSSFPLRRSDSIRRPSTHRRKVAASPRIIKGFKISMAEILRLRTRRSNPLRTVSTSGSSGMERGNKERRDTASNESGEHKTPEAFRHSLAMGGFLRGKIFLLFYSATIIWPPSTFVS